LSPEKTSEKTSETRSQHSGPFDDLSARYRVLVNAEGQHSLWPDFADIPAGWAVVHGPGSRQSCFDYIESSWTDQRPASLIAAMSADAAALWKSAGEQP